MHSLVRCCPPLAPLVVFVVVFVVVLPPSPFFSSFSPPSSPPPPIIVVVVVLSLYHDWSTCLKIQVSAALTQLKKTFYEEQMNSYIHNHKGIHLKLLQEELHRPENARTDAQKFIIYHHLYWQRQWYLFGIVWLISYHQCKPFMWRVYLVLVRPFL